MLFLHRVQLDAAHPMRPWLIWPRRENFHTCLSFHSPADWYHLHAWQGPETPSDTRDTSLASHSPRHTVTATTILSFATGQLWWFSQCQSRSTNTWWVCSNRSPETQQRHTISNMPRGTQAVVSEPTVKTWHPLLLFHCSTCAYSGRLLLTPHKTLISQKNHPSLMFS